jgi:hypothetical protein
VIDPVFLCSELLCPTVGNGRQPIYFNENNFRLRYVRRRVDYRGSVVAANLAV